MLLNDLINKNQKEQSFETIVGTLKLSEEKNIYNSIRTKYQRLSDKISIKFYEKWNSYNDNQEKLEKIEGDIQDCLEEGAIQVKNDLISCKLYDYDEKSIIEKAQENCDLNDINEAYDSFAQKIEAIYDELNEKMEYREMRKNNRGRWSGVTISNGDEGFVDSYIDGAKVQMELEARNLIEGVGHSAFNAIENSISKANARKQIEQICNDEENRDVLVNGLKQSIFKLHITLLTLLGRMEFCQVPGVEAIDKSKRLLSNADNSIISEEEQNKMFVESWQLNPYNEELYGKLVMKDTRHSKIITEIAEYFGIDITAQKDRIALDFLKENLGTTEEDAWEAKEKLLELYETLAIPVSENLESYQMLDKVVKKFDLEYRTVDSVECSSRENADKAREELEEMKEFVANIEKPTKESLLDYENKLLHTKSEFTEMFSSELAPKYMQVIDDNLNEFDKLFCSVGLLNSKLDRKNAGITRAVKYAKELDVSSESATAESKDKLREFLPLVGVTEQEAKDAFEAIDKKREKLVNPTSMQKISGKIGGLFKH